ncbi:carbohydrate-binding protein [Aquimarina sp. 2201CG14-23]|uniref:carbohydrate-binding protein n=1 Tax=Aquimarina mycalae TaxID=3040073 RepID=UPI0024782165|nr:carbohydrate-binding protein [Aquimarina sp. 2201CG14-23]MDH7445440.1 carbohydrate-binding protein [Aquimarina sp. 2201CG14-23]
MRKYIYFLVCLISFSCTTDNDLLEDQSIENHEITVDQSIKSSNPVDLVKSFSSYSYYRGFDTYVRRFTVKVANLAFEKKVSVYHQKVDGNWEEIPMSYNYSIGTDEIWTLDYQNTGSRIYDDEFVIRYEVNGNVYWDNNNGINYSMSRHEGAFFAIEDLNVSADDNYSALFPRYGTDQSQFNVVVDVRNIAPDKDVSVVYTYDGWQTKFNFSLDYNPYWYSGYQQAIVSPNVNNLERWSGYVYDVPADITEIVYAVVYKVNGETYWDNNYGKNYTVRKP